jgi:hypothetical protein
VTTVRDMLAAAYKAGMVLRRQPENRQDSGYHTYKLVGPKFERITASRHTDAGGQWWVVFSSPEADVNYIELCNPTVDKLMLAAALTELDHHLESS